MIVDHLTRPETQPPGPVSAWGLAVICGIRGGHETMRRRIREAIDYGREKLGYRFCANGEGYWLARNAAEWGAFREARRRWGRFVFAKGRRGQEAVVDRENRQGMLFDLRPVGVPDV